MTEVIKPKEMDQFIQYCEKYHYPEILERIEAFRNIQTELAQAILDKHIPDAEIKERRP